jgi:nucleoid-associated protein YgaU
MRTQILWFGVASFSAILLFAAARSNAQDQQPDDEDVAATARQEKAQKPTEAKSPSHVYTNDDLQKSQILTTQDRARVEACKKSAPPPQTLEPAPSLDANDDSPAESLGEVARRYRREKAADAAEQASRPKPPSPFPMDLSEPAFATPAPVGPLLSAPRAPLAPIAPASKPRPSHGPLKRDPFSRPAFSPSWSTPIPGPAPLVDAKPSTVAPPAEPSAPKHALILAPSVVVVPAKPSIVSPSPANHGMAPSKPSTASQATPRRPPVPPASSLTAASSHDARVTVQPGDSLWTLSVRWLGAGSRWQDWLSVNPGVSDPQFIQPGTILVVPDFAPSVRIAPGKVSVQQGDSLWKIAVTHYGNGAEWQCIAAANPAVRDPGQIYPGTTLVLPESCSPAQTAKLSR